MSSFFGQSQHNSSAEQLGKGRRQKIPTARAAQLGEDFRCFF